MNLLSLASLSFLTLSFLTYGLGNISILNFRIVNIGALIFLSLGSLFEAIAIILLLINTVSRFYSHFPVVKWLFVVNGFSVMLLSVIWCWKKIISEGLNAEVGKIQITYIKVTWIFWGIIFCFFGIVQFFLW